MSRFLLLQSVGNANTLIKASMERNEHPLETWRSLSWEYDPKGLGTELLELSDLVSPNKLRAKTLADIICRRGHFTLVPQTSGGCLNLIWLPKTHRWDWHIQGSRKDGKSGACCQAFVKRQHVSRCIQALAP